MSDASPPPGPPGLVIRQAKAKHPRPARPAAVAAAPLPPASFELLEIKSHRALAVNQREIAERVAAAPDLAVMLFINPVLAFERLGVKLAPEVAHHVLHTIQHPKALRARREELEVKLKEALGEPAQPTDAAWNRHLLFELRKLPPLAIGGEVPAYKPPLGEQESAKLHALRPPGTKRYLQKRLLPPRNRVASVPWNESLRRIDLEAPAPKLAHADMPPERVPLEDLWFYKDLDVVVRDALELGVIQRRAFPVHSPDSFRRILAGEKANAFRLWIRSIRFNPGANAPPESTG